MNVKLSKKFRFRTMLVNSDWDVPAIAAYTCTVTMFTASEDAADHNIAYGRIRYWIQNVLQDSVLISKDHKHLREWQSTGARCLILPEDPVDQLVGIMLLCKLSAITQDRLTVQEVALHSDLDDDVVYYHERDDDLGPFDGTDWWNSPGPGHESRAIKRKGNNKVIELNRKEEWKDVHLDWTDFNESTNCIVKADFSKHDGQ
jgi:hypothetical protein